MLLAGSLRPHFHGKSAPALMHMACPLHLTCPHLYCQQSPSSTQFPLPLVLPSPFLIVTSTHPSPSALPPGPPPLNPAAGEPQGQGVRARAAPAEPGEAPHGQAGAFAPMDCRRDGR
eukprot:637835-Pleurochrysis_carterae.AAC.4